VTDHEDHDDEAPSLDDPAFDDTVFDDPSLGALRALLAEARVTEPVPADVAARLDATLASLRTERTARATVVPLRRRLAPVLVAAAAVVVAAGGVGIAQVVRDGGDRTMSASTNADSAGTSRSAAPSLPESAAGQSPGAAPKGDTPAALAAVQAFTTARFAREVAHLDVERLDALTGPTSGEDSTTRSPAPTGTPTGCTGPALPGTESVPILLDGHTAVLVLHPVTDGKQVVDAWSCDGTQRLTTATVTR
jgi:hypothetical protein